jgi:hypothetical protein
MGKTIRRLRQAVGFLQTGWSIVGITLLVLIVTEAGFRASFGLRDWFSAAPSPDPRVLAEGYAGAAWVVEHYRELERLEDRWQPYVYFRQKPFDGNTINIAPDGLRATWQSLPGNRGRSGPKGSLKLLMLGGSSLWGFGARDDQTVPSIVARELDHRGYGVEVRNLAEIGYTSTQEVVALLRELQSGYRPDVVVFYDGVNDTTSAFLDGEAGLTTNEGNRRKEFNLLQSPGRLAAALSRKLLLDSGSYRFAQAVSRKLGTQQETLKSGGTEASMRSLAESAVHTYEANVAIVERLGRSYGFQPLFFWQPTIFDKPSLVVFEREEAAKFGWSGPMFAAVYGGVRSSRGLKDDRAFHDLSRIFAGTEGLVFIDYCHTTETANAPIAAEIVPSVIGAFAQGRAEAGNASPLDGSPRRPAVK